MSELDELASKGRMLEKLGELQNDHFFNVASFKNFIKAQPSIKLSRIEQVLHQKTPEEQYDFLRWLLDRYGMSFTDTRIAVIEWLKGEDGKE